MPTLDLAYIYAYFKRFVSLYVPNIIHTKFNGITGKNTLPYLKASLNITELLLQYHDKEVYNHIKKCHVIFEMFVSDWLIPMFTRAVKFTLIYELWEIFLFERDKYMIFFFSVALFVTHRD